MVGAAFAFVFLTLYASVRPVLDAAIRMARRCTWPDATSERIGKSLLAADPRPVQDC